MSIFAEQVEQTELMALPISILRKVEWEYMDLDNFSEEFNNPKLLRRLVYACKNVDGHLHIFNKILKNHANAIEPENLQFMIDHLKSINFNNISIGSTLFYDRRQVPREFVELNAQYIDMYHVEHQAWIDPEFFEKYENRIDTSNFWDNFMSNHDLESMLLWYSYNNGQYAEQMADSGVMNRFTADKLESVGLPVPEFYSTVITAQRIMSGDPCNDGQRSFAIWLRKYRRVYSDPDGFPTWNQLLELCAKHPRMNGDNYVDWIQSRALHNDPETVSQFPTELKINVRRIDEDDYTREVRDTSDDDATVVVPEFRDETPAVEPATVPPSPFMTPSETVALRGRAPNVAPTFMGAPVGSFSPEMVTRLTGDVRISPEMQEVLDSMRTVVLRPDTGDTIPAPIRDRSLMFGSDMIMNPVLMMNGIHNPLSWNPEEIRIRVDDSGTDSTDESSEPDEPNE